MAKMKQYASPEWQSNPMLAQVREALKELDHIKDALKSLEALASGTPLAGAPGSMARLRNMMYRSDSPVRLYLWLISLNESFVGLQYLWSDRSLMGVQSAQEIVKAYVKEIHEADVKWKAMKLTAIGVAAGKKLAGDLNKQLGLFAD